MFKTLIFCVGLFSCFFGAWLVKAPKKVIELQIAFYRRINWRMEPVDWQREIRNTVVMGWMAIICGLAAIVLLR